MKIICIRVLDAPKENAAEYGLPSLSPKKNTPGQISSPQKQLSSVDLAALHTARRMRTLKLVSNPEDTAVYSVSLFIHICSYMFVYIHIHSHTFIYIHIVRRRTRNNNW